MVKNNEKETEQGVPQATDKESIPIPAPIPMITPISMPKTSQTIENTKKNNGIAKMDHITKKQSQWSDKTSFFQIEYLILVLFL